MTIEKPEARSDVKVAIVDFTHANFVSGVLQAAAELPPNAIVVGGHLHLTTLFDSVTSDTMTIGDADVDNRYAAAINAKTTAYTALVPTGYKYTTRKDIGIKWTGVGTAPTQGAGRLVVQYVIQGRSVSTQG
jgi:hypothetical protein